VLVNRWVLDDDVKSVLDTPQPDGLVDLWREAPDGFARPADARAALVRGYQDSIAQGLVLFQQKAILRAGVSVGFRPEVFAQIANLPGIDVISETALTSLRDGLDMGTLSTAAREVLTEVLVAVGDKMGASTAMPDYAAAVGAVVAVVWAVVGTIVNAENEWKAYWAAKKLEALDCAPPFYSATSDQNLAKEAVALLGSPDWSDIFLPVVRPALGFTCCISAVDGGRVITPVGLGIGNRFQSAFEPGGGASGEWNPEVYGSKLGFGCLPMLPGYPAHRAIVFPNGMPHLIYDPAWSLAQLGGVGIQAFKLLANLGPATYTVDGDGIGDAWSGYFQAMRVQIATNGPGIGTAAWNEPVCDDWGKEGRLRALEFLWRKLYPGGEVPAAAFGDGIWTFEDSLPVSHWRAFSAIQGALLGYRTDGEPKGPPRLVAAYVNARTCHPAWRSRVDQAQRELLDLGDAVCRMDRSSIHDREYREAVTARYLQKKAPCWALNLEVSANFKGGVTATEGPSLEPLAEGSPPIPAMPAFPKLTTLRATTASAEDAEDESGGGWLLAAFGVGAAVGLGALALRGRGGRRRGGRR
jgi:hypothetical protein